MGKLPTGSMVGGFMKERETPSVLESDEFLTNPHLGSIANAAPYVTFPPEFFTKFAEATGPVWDAINRVFLGESEVQESLDQAVDLANRILRDN